MWLHCRHCTVTVRFVCWAHTHQPIAQKVRPEAVLLIGPPACGKSTITSVHFPTYTRINQAWACFDVKVVPICVIDRFAAWQDLLKTRKKCLDVAAAELAAGHSIVIDATNKDASVRTDAFQRTQCEYQ